MESARSIACARMSCIRLRHTEGGPISWPGREDGGAQACPSVRPLLVAGSSARVGRHKPCWQPEDDVCSTPGCGRPRCRYGCSRCLARSCHRTWGLDVRSGGGGAEATFSAGPREKRRVCDPSGFLSQESGQTRTARGAALTPGTLAAFTSPLCGSAPSPLSPSTRNPPRACLVGPPGVRNPWVGLNGATPGRAA
jgi:hypothetical protein